ncbi:MAG: PAS domain S-box protein [FCB group bacterium]|nr:PAS domain S-box protein [FCB group bacterium]MBL7028176.1 PAS domain S-box protein [Candidatus Neomarinimicrobiota bacterium]MBL7122518.1 PAS domain S-box protein [Candidatus Neomarinimicrobiota bacterium]
MSQLKNDGLVNTELRRFLDSLTDWVWEMDVNGIHTYSNNAVQTILGYEARELIGRHVSMFWPIELATPEKIDTFNTELKDGVPWQHFRGRFRHKNGDLKILESSGEPLFDEGGKLIGFRGVDRDIEQSILHEEALQKSNDKYKDLAEKLEWENEFKSLLLDIINHDIMNPVNAIYGISDMLRDESPENKMIQTINSSSLRLIEVISNARALTQISMN